MVTNQASQRSGRKSDPSEKPNAIANAKVAVSAPTIRISELATPFRNSEKAGAVLSIGRVTSMPNRFSNQSSVAETEAANGVGLSSRLSAGRTQFLLVLPSAVLHSGRCQMR